MAGAEVVELADPDSPALALFDSVFDSVLASVPVFFSAGADSEAVLLDPDELLFDA